MRVALPLYLAVGLIVASRFFSLGELGSTAYRGDHRLHIWTLAWENHALLTKPADLFDANIFHPNENTLAYTEHCFFLSLLMLPLNLATGNPVLAFNVVLLLMLPASGAAAFLLIRHLTGRADAGFVGGLVFGCSSYMTLHFHDLINLVSLVFTPLAVLFLERWLEQPEFRRVCLCPSLSSGRP